MNYEHVCKILEELMVELMKKGITIPQQLIDDLKSGRTLISIYKEEPAELDRAMETTPFLQKVESNLLYLADSEIGKGYANEWQGKISRAYLAESERVPSISRFISGIPKGDYWVRIKTSELSIGDELSELLNQHNLSARPEKDSYLLVHGRKEDISSFLKEVRQKESKTKL
jgi:hypothetical protein